MQIIKFSQNQERNELISESNITYHIDSTLAKQIEFGTGPCNDESKAMNLLLGYFVYILYFLEN